MVKTTLYLPEELKRKVELAARRRGVSEADVIRAAITREVGEEPVPDAAARFPVFHSGNREPFAERDEELLNEIGFGER